MKNSGTLSDAAAIPFRCPHVQQTPTRSIRRLGVNCSCQGSHVCLFVIQSANSCVIVRICVGFRSLVECPTSSPKTPLAPRSSCESCERRPRSVPSSLILTSLPMGNKTWCPYSASFAARKHSQMLQSILAIDQRHGSLSKVIRNSQTISTKLTQG